MKSTIESSFLRQFAWSGETVYFSFVIIFFRSTALFFVLHFRFRFFSFLSLRIAFHFTERWNLSIRWKWQTKRVEISIKIFISILLFRLSSASHNSIAMWQNELWKESTEKIYFLQLLSLQEFKRNMTTIYCADCEMRSKTWKRQKTEINCVFNKIKRFFFFIFAFDSFRMCQKQIGMQFVLI